MAKIIFHVHGITESADGSKSVRYSLKYPDASRRGEMVTQLGGSVKLGDKIQIEVVSRDPVFRPLSNKEDDADDS